MNWPICGLRGKGYIPGIVYADNLERDKCKSLKIMTKKHYEVDTEL
jgi:hypothetical protein